jgi:hypothetical protein
MKAMMRKHMLAMAGVSALGLATAIGSANAITLAPIGSDMNVIQVQGRTGGSGGDMGRGGGGGGEMNRGGGQGGGALSGRSGGDAAVRGGGDVRGGGQFQRSEGPRAQRNEGPRVGTADRVTRSRGDDGRRSMNRGDGDRQFSRNFDRGHRHAHRGWSRDRRHIFYGAALIGVPFGYAAYASHPCYDWVAGPRGVGYYWNYDRCPV